MNVKNNNLDKLFKETDYSFEQPSVSSNHTTYKIKSSSGSENYTAKSETGFTSSIFSILAGLLIFFLTVILISLIALYINKNFGKSLPSSFVYLFIISVMISPFLVTIKIFQLIKSPSALKLLDNNNVTLFKIVHEPSLFIFSVKYNLLNSENEKIASFTMTSPLKQNWKCFDSNNNLTFLTKYEHKSFGYNIEKYKVHYDIFNSKGMLAGSIVNNNIISSNYTLNIKPNVDLNWMIFGFAMCIDLGINQKPFSKLA